MLGRGGFFGLIVDCLSTCFQMFVFFLFTSSIILFQSEIFRHLPTLLTKFALFIHPSGWMWKQCVWMNPLTLFLSFFFSRLYTTNTLIYWVDFHETVWALSSVLSTFFRAEVTGYTSISWEQANERAIIPSQIVFILRYKEGKHQHFVSSCEFIFGASVLDALNFDNLLFFCLAAMTPSQIVFILIVSRCLKRENFVVFNNKKQ